MQRGKLVHLDGEYSIDPCKEALRILEKVFVVHWQLSNHVLNLQHWSCLENELPIFGKEEETSTCTSS